MKNDKIQILVLLLLFVLFKVSYSQTIRAQVSLNTERLTNLLPEEEQVFQLLPQQLNDYLNNYNWSGGENPDIVINCSINLIVESMTPRGSEKIYTGQFLISSPSGENYVDKTCQFRYQPGQPIDHQRSYFDPLLSLFDFYIYMVLGGEFDTWLILSGTRYYDLALAIANQGIISDYSSGWRNRTESVQSITDSDHMPLREAKFYYYDCLYNIEAKRDRQVAVVLSAQVIELLEQTYNKRPQSKALLRFFNAHFNEFCNLFTYNPDEDLINRLMFMDPRHTETYRGCLP